VLGLWINPFSTGSQDAFRIRPAGPRGAVRAIACAKGITSAVSPV
jgi:hypothetical protein